MKHLQIGEQHFGEAPSRLRTVVGSCVAITLWHRAKRIGGMCHYMLPQRRTPCDDEDGRYADGALRFFLRRIRQSGTRVEDYEAKLFGGGSMFDGAKLDVGAMNVAAGRRLLREHGFAIHGEHTAGAGHRVVLLDVASGEVWLHHLARDTRW